MLYVISCFEEIKIDDDGTIFGKILASYKRPSEKMRGGGQTDLFFCSMLPNALYLITKQTSLFYSYSKENSQYSAGNKSSFCT